MMEGSWTPISYVGPDGAVRGVCAEAGEAARSADARSGAREGRRARGEMGTGVL
jgi:hypothetical protein